MTGSLKDRTRKYWHHTLDRFTAGRGLFVCLLSFFILAELIIPLSSAQAVQVGVRAGMHPTYGRLVFDWPSQVQFGAEIANQKLTIRFSDRIDADYSTVPARLARYIGSATPGPDGQSVTFDLKGDFSLNSLRSGNRVIIDISVPRGGQQVVTKVGDLDAGAVATVSTPAPTETTSTPAPANPTETPDDAEAEETIETTAQAPLPVRVEKKIEKVNPIAIKGQRIEVRVGQHDQFSRLVFDWPARVDYVTTRVGNTIRVKFPVDVKPDIKRLRVDPPSFIDDARVVRAGGTTTVEIEIADRAGVRHFLSGNNVVVDITAPGPSQEILNVKEDLEEQREAIRQAKEEQQQLLEAPIDVEFEWVPEMGVRIHFPWRTDVAAAAFRRGENLWVVFDQGIEMRMDRMPAKAITYVNDPVQTLGKEGFTDRMSIVKAKLQPGVRPRVSRDGNEWIVDLVSEDFERPRSITITREPDDSGNSAVFIHLVDPGRLIEVKDDELGDELSIITARQVNSGVPEGRNFVEFSVLPSAQGIAISPRAENLRITRLRQGVSVTTPGGLTLSSRGQTAISPSALRRGIGASPAFLDIESWQEGIFDGEKTDVLGFEDVKHSLFFKAALRTEKAQEKARMNYARYLFANGAVHEAAGVVGVMAQDNEVLLLDPAFRTLRGAIRVTERKYKAAVDDLTHRSLFLDPHAAIWLSMARAGEFKWLDALTAYNRAQDAIEAYPRDIKIDYYLNGARAALNVKEGTIAETALARIIGGPFPDYVNAEKAMMEGWLMEERGRMDEALEKYDEAIFYEDLAAGNEATLRKNLLMEKLGRQTRGRTITNLERLRYHWRGDDIELRTLEELGLLYVADGQFRAGLETMKIAVENFPNNPGSRRVNQRMANVFKDLFLRNLVADMSPVKALGLYYDFREMTPVGKDGDEMIRQLADKLVAVDLLPQAAELLSHQVNFRLKGVARSQVAARLAVVYLLDQQPEKALNTLRNSRQTRLPDKLYEERLLLESQALADLYRYGLALELLEDDTSLKAERLRAHIYWGQQDWPNAAKKNEELLGDRWRNAQPMDATERSRVMRAAIAYSLAEDKDSLIRMRDRYGPNMEESSDAAAFAVVTQQIEKDGVAFRELAEVIANIDTLENFMTEYKKMLREGGLSAIN